jgi:hypothetical protein
MNDKADNIVDVEARVVGEQNQATTSKKKIDWAFWAACIVGMAVAKAIGPLPAIAAFGVFSWVRPRKGVFAATLASTLIGIGLSLLVIMAIDPHVFTAPSPPAQTAKQLDLSEFKTAPTPPATGNPFDQFDPVPTIKKEHPPQEYVPFTGVLDGVSTNSAPRPVTNQQHSIASFLHEDAVARPQSQPATRRQPSLPDRQVAFNPPTKRAFSAQEQADLNAVVARAAADYPYLDTPAGAPVIEKILTRRDELIQQGVYPSIALIRALNAFAPGNAP